MTLKEKLYKVYQEIARIEKGGYNSAQKYDYVKASDVTHAVRKQLIDLKVYAEINFDFVGDTFTIARAKDKDAPFSAVRVKCSVVFHDLESLETLTSSGLGTGCDNNDKAAYKAQTGALKYALKNAFLIPDDADPEADTTVDDRGDAQQYPDETQADFREPYPEARSMAAPRAQLPASLPPTTSPFPPEVFTAAPATQTAAPVPNREPGDESYDTGEMPTKDEMDAIRLKYKAFSDDIIDKGKLGANRGLKISDKIRTFVLYITKSPDIKFVTKFQWDDFFQRAEAAIANPEVGYIGLVKLVNKANGIEEKK